MRSSTSERLEIRTLLKRAKAHDTDGRAVRLLMLELETAEYQPAMAPLLEGPGAKLSTLDGMKLEAQIEMLDISPQLRAVLSPMV